MLGKCLFFLLSIGVLISSNIYGQQYDVIGVRNILADFVRAWNSHDVKTMASLWADDGDLVNPWGKWGRSKNNVERILQEDQSSELGKTTMEQTLDSMRFFLPDFVLVDATSTLSNVNTSNETKSYFQEFHVIYLLQKKDNAWKILSARPYILQGRLTKVK